MSSAVAVLQPWPLKILVDYALGDTPTPSTIESFLDLLSVGSDPAVLVVLAAAVSIGIFALGSFLDFGMTWGWTAAGQGMVYDLAGDLFQRYQQLSLLFHRKRSVGDALSRLTGDTYCMYSATSDLFISPVQNVVTLTAIISVAWALDPVLTTISLVVAPIMAIWARYFGPKLNLRTRINREARSRVMSFVHQTLTSVPVVQAFGTEDENRSRYQELADDAVSSSQSQILLKSSFGLMNGLVITAGTAIVLYVGGLRVLSGSLSLGSLLVLLAYLRTIQGTIRDVIGTYGRFKTVQANMDRVVEVLDSEEFVAEAPDAITIPDRKGAGAHIKLENVSFGYEPGRPVLQNVTMEAKPDETIALVGSTGAGKTTLVSLLLRFFDPWQGRVMFNGVDISTVRLADLRGEISLLLQDPFLLPFSVAENISYGRPTATRADIVEAAKAAGAHDFIMELPERYDTVIGDLGSSLSQGQKQRLAIARALLRDTPLLILDEPTSALDAQTEADLVESLERLRTGRTTILIAHRLSTIRSADRIFVLEGGRVIEEGSHEDLIGLGGRYHNLYSIQRGEVA